MENKDVGRLMIDNLGELQKEVKFTGFDHYFDQPIEEKILASEKDFQLGRGMEVEAETMDRDIMNYNLYFRVDESARKGYLNDMDATLQIAATGEQRTHTFPRYLRITAKEAYNLLKYGNKTAVQKRLFNKEGKPYLSYITLDINGPKDKQGNYPLQQYHENYYGAHPFLLEEATSRLPIPVKELETAQGATAVLSSLKRGNAHRVTIFHNGEQGNGFLTVNARTGQIDVRNAEMEVIASSPSRKQLETGLGQENPTEKPDEIKKKFNPQQKVSWHQKSTVKQGI